MLNGDGSSLEWWHGLQTDGGDACMDYDILSATDLHKRIWIMQVCLAHLYFILIKRKAIFQSAPTNPQEKLGPSFQGTQPRSLCG